MVRPEVPIPTAGAPRPATPCQSYRAEDRRLEEPRKDLRLVGSECGLTTTPRRGWSCTSRQPSGRVAPAEARRLMTRTPAACWTPIWSGCAIFPDDLSRHPGAHGDVVDRPGQENVESPDRGGGSSWGAPGDEG